METGTIGQIMQLLTRQIEDISVVSSAMKIIRIYLRDNYTPARVSNREIQTLIVTHSFTQVVNHVLPITFFQLQNQIFQNEYENENHESYLMTNFILQIQFTSDSFEILSILSSGEYGQAIISNSQELLQKICNWISCVEQNNVIIRKRKRKLKMNFQLSQSIISTNSTNNIIEQNTPNVDQDKKISTNFSSTNLIGKAKGVTTIVKAKSSSYIISKQKLQNSSIKKPTSLSNQLQTNNVKKQTTLINRQIAQLNQNETLIEHENIVVQQQQSDVDLYQGIIEKNLRQIQHSCISLLFQFCDLLPTDPLRMEAIHFMGKNICLMINMSSNEGDNILLMCVSCLSSVLKTRQRDIKMDSSCGIQRVGRNSRSSLTALLNQLMTFEEEFVEFAEDIGLVDSLYLVSYHWNKEAQLPAVLILVNFANSMLGC